ncbi:MarR family winged helix-turn-helix transcriptional regulator [Aeromicrobium duanguangcaii]|uniref:MarR family transcriptional regulator n=1 Tax=Aeromicrobium duanguangcaii TaxID=2968086 RepID=A0ABY5KE38_9ACTN|nr:MarR family transcriptional regulator [Aeromicrobium duanguangcaii]MCD9154370.1 MarR family transcriptional regulator [Aeromicrobium duanguangcaii]MCL3838115.1 MarR family transcriptional regulator [Aeromicrobium duanguangcaii]UUI68564.1 MarR family transcriptional regulator [Aeromicrobium duanguangcaii]
MTHEYTDDERALLRAVRHLVRADRDMRARLSASMRVNPTDLRSIRHVMRAVEAQDSDETEVSPGGVTPRKLADHLGISTAAVTTLVDRLVASGHLTRAPHPTDRRSVILLPTELARSQMDAHLLDMHDRMKRIAAAVPESARPALIEFLEALTREMERDRLDVSRD